MAEIRHLLFLQNPWWQNANFVFSESAWPKREIFKQFEDYLHTHQITALIGLRRVGKTTMIRQAINSLIEKKTSLTSICYFSFEEIGVARQTETLEAVIEIFLNEIKKTSIWKADKVYFFFDEIQYIPHWQSIIKRYYDVNKNLKFIISGSSSLFLRKEAKEALAGRIFEIKVPPLSFYEYLLLKAEKNLFPKIDIWNPSQKPPFFNLSDLLRLKGLFTNYLSTGQFPELLTLDSFEKKKQYLKNWVIEKIIDVDLPSLVEIRYQETFKNLVYILMEGSGQEVEFTNLAEDLGVSRESIRQYISYLEKTLLIYQVINFAGSFRRRERRNRKIYCASSNFVSVVLGENEMGTGFQKNLGKIVETFVCHTFMTKFSEVFFWKERGKEVDFIIKKNGEDYPVEVKFQEKIRKEDYKNLLILMKKKKYPYGFILTSNQWEEKKIDDKIIYLRPVFFI